MTRGSQHLWKPGSVAGILQVPCALQWAQNSTTVFLGVKYASRWSAPGAIEVADVGVKISEAGAKTGGMPEVFRRSSNTYAIQAGNPYLSIFVSISTSISVSVSVSVSVSLSLSLHIYNYIYIYPTIFYEQL